MKYKPGRSRRKAIVILQYLADLSGKEDLFDGVWSQAEDRVVEIIEDKKEYPYILKSKYKGA